ncbi:unnamed protein product [Pieris brassicae]|uniref:Peptidase S1 domain-containing protein n=1 Tax=Pieris brassicae TaxID=7116 RepID=A0A9P0TGI3_PIEBR|nr:unnamed protein product [Pieris brassicae]
MFTSILPIFLVAVVSAKVARNHEVPYQASIRSDFGHMCSGAILYKNWILTAARCGMSLRRRKVQYVVVGTNDIAGPGTSFPVEIIHVHPKHSHYKYDIAVVKLNGTIKFNDKIQPIQFPERSTKPGANMLFSGWKGPSDSNQTNNLLMRNVTSITSDACQKEIGPHLELYQICTIDNDPYRKGEEFFDGRGGPIVEGSRLAAIASISRTNNSASIHTRVYELLTWIIVTIDPDSRVTD